MQGSWPEFATWLIWFTVLLWFSLRVEFLTCHQRLRVLSRHPQFACAIQGAPASNSCAGCRPSQRCLGNDYSLEGNCSQGPQWASRIGSDRIPAGMPQPWIVPLSSPWPPQLCIGHIRTFDVTLGNNDIVHSWVSGDRFAAFGHDGNHVLEMFKMRLGGCASLERSCSIASKLRGVREVSTFESGTGMQFPWLAWVVRDHHLWSTLLQTLLGPQASDAWCQCNVPRWESRASSCSHWGRKVSWHICRLSFPICKFQFCWHPQADLLVQWALAKWEP